MIGPTQSDWLINGIEEYKKRLAHYIPFEIIELPNIKNKAGWTEEKLKLAECIEFEKRLEKEDSPVALDEKGKQLGSVDFSEYLQKKMNLGVKSIVFIVGGAFGIHDRLLNRCHDRISLSSMTFSHQMVRLIFSEQLYRGLSILKNEKYHHK